MLSIIVCVKQVLDPEAPTSTYRIDESAKRVVQKGVPPVMSPFDENALEAALKIKAANGAKVTVLSMGQNLSRPIMRKVLAAGADDLIFLEDPAFDSLDSYASAQVLASAIRKLNQFDLILTGRQAADSNAGVVGLGIAVVLSLPSVATAGRIEIGEGKARVESILPYGSDWIETPLPALITVSNEAGGLRVLALKDIMAAQKRPINAWNCAALGLDPAALRRTRLISLSLPIHEGKCEIVQGTTPEQAGELLAVRLKGAKAL